MFLRVKYQTASFFSRKSLNAESGESKKSENFRDVRERAVPMIMTFNSIKTISDGLRRDHESCGESLR